MSQDGTEESAEGSSICPLPAYCPPVAELLFSSSFKNTSAKTVFVGRGGPFLPTHQSNQQDDDSSLPTDLVDVWPTISYVGPTVDHLLRQVMEAEQGGVGIELPAEDFLDTYYNLPSPIINDVVIQNPKGRTTMSLCFCSMRSSASEGSCCSCSAASEDYRSFSVSEASSCSATAVSCSTAATNSAVQNSGEKERDTTSFCRMLSASRSPEGSHSCSAATEASCSLTPSDSDAHNSSKSGRITMPFCCRVCSKPAKHYHHGVFSCKACTLFFRRALANFRQYDCVETKSMAPGDCVNCNACRFDRCLQLEMNFSTIKMPKDVDMELVEKWVSKRKGALMKKRQKYWDSSSTCSDSVIERALFLDDAILDDRELTRLRYFDSRFNRVRWSICSLELFELSRKTLDDIFMDPINILNHSEQFNTEIQPRVVVASPITIDVFLTIEVLKATPLVSLLDRESLKKLTRNVAFALRTMCDAYHSWRKGLDVVEFANGLRPLTFNYSILPAVRRRLYFDGLKPFREVELSHDEYLLVRALIFSTFTTPGLSPYARKLLHSESQRYQKALLQNCQRRLGVERGLQRFDELAQLANKMFTFGALAANFARYFVHDKRLYTVPSFVMECLVDNPTIPPMESWDNI